MVDHLDIALRDADDRPDLWAGLRPILGYGLDQLERVNQRLESTNYWVGTWVDRLHNWVFDSWLSLGLIGFILQTSIYIFALWVILSRLGLLPSRRYTLTWLFSICVGGAVGLLAVRFAVPAHPGLVVIGVGLGSITGFLVWLGRQAFCGLRCAELQPADVPVVLLGCLIIQHVVFNQFHFTHILGQTFWWIALGLLIHHPSPTPVSIMTRLPAEIVCLPIVYLVYSYGITWSLDAPLPLAGISMPILGVIFIMLCMGWWLSEASPTRRWTFATSLIAAMILFVLQSVAVKMFPTALVFATGLLGLSGPFMIAFTLILASSARRSPSLGARMRTVTVSIVIVAMLIYGRSWYGSVLHRRGDSLFISDPNSAHLIYNLALNYTFVSSPIRLSDAYLSVNMGDVAGTLVQWQLITSNDRFLALSRDMEVLQNLLCRPHRNGVGTAISTAYNAVCHDP
jgi:hypothetical protein